MSFVTVSKHSTGPRLFLLERRMHHGDWGLLAIFGGLCLCWRDKRDAKDWFHFKREVTR